MVQNKRQQAQVKEIVHGGGAYVTRVINAKPEKGYFFVRCDGRQVFCHVNEGRPIMAGSKHPEFRRGTVNMPNRGDDVVLFVGTDAEGRPCAETWGYRSDLSAAEDLIKSRTAPSVSTVPSRMVGEPQRKVRTWPSINGGRGRSTLSPGRQLLEEALSSVSGAQVPVEA